MRAESAEITDPHTDLIELIEACCRSGVARQALMLSARRMPPHLARPHHLRLAHEALDPLATADRAHSFDLPDGSRVLIWRGDAGALLDRARGLLAHLLDGDVDLASLAPLYHLPEDAEALRLALQEATASPIVAAAPAKPREKLGPASLQALEQSLTQVNVSRFARHRRLWRITPNGRLETAWDKRFLSVTELTDSILPDHDPTADPWLFRRLTRTLDRRLLSLLAAPDELRAAGPFSLDLNVGTLLAPEFLRFDAALPAHLRGQLVIELLPADILADPAGYMFARGFARARRYRIMIREIPPSLLAALDFRAIDPDYVELIYTPEQEEMLRIQMAQTAWQGSELVLAYANHPGRIDQAARSFAQANGIRLLAPRD